MVRGIPSISIPNLSYSIAHSGKMSLPVDSSALVYSHFEHVSGVAAPKGTQGVSINHLHLLDVLISQVNQIKSGAISQRETVPAASANNAQINASHFNGEYVDALIESYTNQISQAKASSEAMPYIPSPEAQSGAVFNLIF